MMDGEWFDWFKGLLRALNISKLEILEVKPQMLKNLVEDAWECTTALKGNKVNCVQVTAKE